METAWHAKSKPPGIRALSSMGFFQGSLSFPKFQLLVGILTFMSYTLYHASRKPLSIVKGVLHPVPVVHNSNATGSINTGWPPFDGPSGRTLLGEVDLAFLFCYSVGMFFSGHLADRLNLRLFLALGMVGSGAFACVFGMGFFWNSHSLLFYLLANMLAGVFQSTGWPSVVSAMGNWFGKEGRGLVMGIWNSHTSLGNILGSLVASAALSLGWGWAFLVPGLAISFGGLLVYLFMPAEPEDLGFESPHSEDSVEGTEDCAGLLWADERGDATEGGKGTAGCPEAAPHEHSTASGVSSVKESSQILSCCKNEELKEPLLQPGAPSRTSSAGANVVLLVTDQPGSGNGNGVAVSELNEAPAERNPEADAVAHSVHRSAAQGKIPAGPNGKLDAVVPIRATCPEDEDGAQAVGFLEAWRIPGVAAYAFCLFFAKLVAYTFLNWLPFYMSHTKIHGEYISDALSGVTSTVFDLGGVAGGILAGHLSDRFGTQALVSALFMLGAVPALGLYYQLGHLAMWINVVLLAVVGFFVNGPYALITCAVSADLGQHRSLKGNAKALSTVTGIIDGTGSLGAAIGPFFTGIVADFLGGWAGVFGMLMFSSMMSVICIAKLAREEWTKLMN